MSEMSETNVKRDKRESGSGCLIPPRPGVTSFWTAQVYDKNGKLVRRSTKVRGELTPGADPKQFESWSNIMKARAFLKNLLKQTEAGTVAVGSDPSQLRYGTLRQLYLNDYQEQKHKSLLYNAETGEAYVCGLNHLDEFFGYDDAADGEFNTKGDKVSTITADRIREFKTKRQAAGAANGTVNRSLSALTRMFTLAVEDGKLQIVPVIKSLPEPKQPRQGFLGVIDYQKLYDALGVEVKNQALGTVSRPYAYVQPILQTGYYTGMRLSEILNLKWSNVDLAGGFIHLWETKNDEPRDIPMIDGLPKMFETLKRANPKAGQNDLVFLNDSQPIKSFIKAWRNACIRAALPTKLNGVTVTSHFSTGPECCSYCKKLSESSRPIEKDTYVGFVFHDLRRTFVSNMVEAGVDPLDAKAISGHKTDSVFERYNIKSMKRAEAAGKKMTESLRLKEAEVSSPPARLQAVNE